MDERHLIEDVFNVFHVVGFSPEGFKQMTFYISFTEFLTMFW